MRLQMGSRQRWITAMVVGLSLGASSAFATNGMNLGGYGPISSGMGGTAAAHNVGLAGSMSNPATLGLIDDENRLEVGIGFLGPKMKAEMEGQTTAESTATSFWLPGLGYMRRMGDWSVGAALYAQGGLGAEFGPKSFLALGSDETVRSELGVLRAMVPVAYRVTPDLIVAGSADYLHAGLDLKMAVSPAQFADMATPGQQTIGKASGTLVTAMAPMMGGLQWARFDFSDSSALTQEAAASGWGGKLGALYKVMPELTIGASYHLKTTFGDMATTKATMSANVTGPGTIPVAGTLKVEGFSWPSTAAIGAAYKPMSKLLLALDYKRIGWASAMKSVKMNFVANDTQAAAATGLEGKVLDVEFFQNWEDQNVFALGAAYQLTDALVLRAGANLANNPVPEALTIPLFGAIVKNEYSLGAGYALTDKSSVDLSGAYAPEVAATNADELVTKVGGMAAQLSYSQAF